MLIILLPDEYIVFLYTETAYNTFYPTALEEGLCFINAIRVCISLYALDTIAQFWYSLLSNIKYRETT